MPGAFAAVCALLIVSLITLGLPSDPAHVPIGTLEVAFLAPHMPATRIRLHGLRPRGGKDKHEESLDQAHTTVFPEMAVTTFNAPTVSRTS